MNNDVYNNKKGSSLEEAYAKLREAQAQRNASVNQKQYDMTNGVALNTTPLAYNKVQSLSQENLTQTQEQSSDANWAVRLAGTITQGLRNVGKGFLKLGEGVVDAHLAIGGLFNKEWAENVVKFDVTNAIMEWEAENASINALYKNKTGRNLYDESYLNDANEKVQNIVQGVEQGVGNALGFMALSAIPYAGVGLTIMGAGGTSLEENFNDPNYNGNFYGAWGNAAISGGIEAGLERVLGWSPKKTGVSTKTFANVLKSLGKDFVEEGAEEVASDVIKPFLEGMYTDKTLKESWDEVTLESLGETFLVGGLTGVVMSGAGEVYSTVYLSPEGQKIAHEINENQAYYKQAYEDFKKNPNEQQAYDKFIEVRNEVANNLKGLGERVGKLASKYQNRLSSVVTIDGEKVSIKEALESKSQDTAIADPTKMAVAETIKLARDSGIKGWEDMDIEFVTEGTDAYKQAFGNRIGNGVIKGNKIYLSTNSVAARKFVLGHELLHALKQSSSEGAYESVRQEIMDSLEKDRTYNNKFNATKETYTDQETGKVPSFEDVEEEMVADYLGEHIKNFDELQKLFENQSAWNKFVDKIKSLRKNKTNNKARDLYQRLIKSAKDTKYETKSQEPNIAFNKAQGIKFSLPTLFGIVSGTDMTGLELTEKKLRDNNYSQEEIDKVINDLKDIANHLKTIAEQEGFKSLKNFLNAKPTISTVNGKTVMSCLIANGDYVLNFDLSATCKKKVAYQKVIDYLAVSGFFDENYFNAIDPEGWLKDKKTKGLSKKQSDILAERRAKFIDTIQTELRKRGFEVPCTMCFVESKRQFQFDWAINACDMVNSAIDKARKKQKKLPLNKNNTEDYHNFTKQVDWMTAGNEEAESVAKAYQSFKESGYETNEKDNFKLTGSAKSNQKKVDKIIEQLIDKGADVKYLSPADLLTSRGIEAVKSFYAKSGLFSIFQASYGAGTPKMNYGNTPYNSEVALLNNKYVKMILGKNISGLENEVRNIKNEAEYQNASSQEIEDEALRRVAYNLGGLRFQSFSDFRIEQLLDVMQLFADLTARRLPLELYTKEAIEIEIFGLTGAKMNMSVISKLYSNTNNKHLAGLREVTADKPVNEDISIWLEVDENGNPIIVNDQVVEAKFENGKPIGNAKQYTTDFADDYANYGKNNEPVQSFKWKKALEILRSGKGYDKNCGVIAIAFSDAHAKALMRSKYISMVIPYHASGVIKAFAKKYHFDNVMDYTDFQSTKIDTIKATDKNGKEVRVTDAMKKAALSERNFNFNQELRDGVNKNNPRGVAKQYYDFCKTKLTKEYVDKDGKTFTIEATFKPKFESLYKNEENYYKVLADFSLFDQQGNYCPQKSVEWNFPNNIKELIKSPLNLAKLTDEKLNNEFKEIGDIAIKESNKIGKASLQTPASQQVKYSLSPSKQELVELAGEYVDIGQEKQQIDLWTEEMIKRLQCSNITFTANASKVVIAMKKLARDSYKNPTEFKRQVRAMVRQWAESIRVDGKTMHSFLGVDKNSSELKAFITEIVNNTTNGINQYTYDSNKARQNVIDDMIETTIKSFEEQIAMYRQMSQRARKATLKIATIKYWGKSTIDPKANYGENKLEGIFQASAKAISDLQFNPKTTKLDKSYGALILALKDFYANEDVKKFKNKDQAVNEYIEEALNYFAQRYNANPNKALETDNVINDTNYPMISGKSEIEVYADILTEMRRIINASRKVTYAELDGQRVIAKDVAKEEIEKQKQVNRNTKLVNNFFTKGASAYLTSLVDIKTYMTIMSHGDANSLMMKLYNQLFEGQKETYRIHQDLMSGLRKKLTSKEGKKLGKSLKKKKLTFKGIEMTYGEAISLYMMMKTDNAYTHLVGEGIKLETNKVGQERRILGSQFASFETEANLQEREMIESILDLEIKKGATYSQEQLDYLATLGGNPNKSNPRLKERLTELNQEAIEEARKALKEEIGSEYDELISTLEEMYTKSGKYYVSASEKMLGMSFTPKKYYYPTKSAKTELSEVDALASFVHTTLNPSFTKKTTGGSNALYVGDVIDTALGFAKTLSTYAGVTVEVKNVQKFLNAKYKDSNGVQITLNDYLNNNVDNRFSSRIDGLFKAMQGIEVGKQSDIGKALKWIRSMAAKSALGANIKTIITQFSSYPKAFMFLSGKSVLKGIFSREKGRFNDGLVDFKWAREHSPFINNRYLDNNVYNIESIGALSKVDALTDLAMKPIELTDMATLARIWYACQYEVMENGVVDHDKALKLFEQVTADTQAQYDALGNGSVTRTGNEVMNSFLMYSAENRKTLSRIIESIYLVAVSPKGSDARKKAGRYLAKTTASVMTQALAVTLIAALLRGLKGDYDDKEKEEIIKEILIDEFSMNFVGMLPIIKDIYNYLINGYDIQVSGVSQMTEFLDVFSKYIPTLLNVESTDADRKTAWIQLLTKVGHFFGVPVRNLYNGLMYLGGTADLFFDTNIALQMKNLYYNTNNTGLNTYLKTYTKRGNMDGASKVIQLKFNKYISGDIDDASAKEMARLYSVGALTSFPTQLTTSMTFEGEEVTLTKAQISHAKEVYALANDILPQMLKSSTYRDLSDEEKAFAIKKLFDTYHDLAKQEVFEGYEGSRLSRVADYVNVSKFASALAKINNIEQTKTQSRKMLVQKYINSLSMKASEKYLLLYLAGYSLNDEKQNVVKSYLRQNGMNYRHAKEFMV